MHVFSFFVLTCEIQGASVSFPLKSKDTLFYLMSSKVYWHPRMGTKEKESILKLPLQSI